MNFSSITKSLRGLTNRKRPSRARFFLEHIIEEGKIRKEKLTSYYAPAGIKFLNKFRPVLIKGPNHTFLIDLKKGSLNFPISLSIVYDEASPPIFRATIHFSKNTITVETIQGNKKSITELREFESAVGLPAARYLIREICEQGKKLGYNEVKLARPEYHPSYENPVWANGVENTTERNRQERLIQRISDKEVTSGELAEFKDHKKVLTERIQARMKKLYSNVAENEGFQIEGLYFTKRL